MYLQLRSVCVLAMVRHAQQPPRVMRKVELEFIREGFLPVGLTALSCARRVPTLNLYKGVDANQPVASDLNY